ncbi:phosphoglycerate dehydrogenase-like enzyme [Microbacterium sp. ZKA21]|uniref:hydroxyacid dehydrogenase n=1 Tax=Microbacterium sp. ZKA21 TaxID=3381694 RepID=UPI003D1BD34E
MLHTGRAAPPTVAFLMPEDTFSRVFGTADIARLLAEPRLRLLAAEPLDLSAPGHRRMLAEAQIVITGWDSPELRGDALAALPSVRAVAHSAGTVRPIVTDELLALGVDVASSASANAVPVAEFTLAMIILAAKRAFWSADRLRAERRKPDAETAWPTVGANGVRVGVVGASHIGRLVLRHLERFDLEVVVADPTLTARQRRDLGVPCIALDDLFASSDIVTLHAPSLPSTQGMIDRDRIALMRPGATLINTARGDLVDSIALAERLRRGDLVALLDVTDPEPLPEGHALWSTPNTFLTPHIAGSQGTELARLAEHVIDEVIHYAANGRFIEPITVPQMAVMA